MVSRDGKAEVGVERTEWIGTEAIEGVERSGRRGRCRRQFEIGRCDAGALKVKEQIIVQAYAARIVEEYPGHVGLMKWARLRSVAGSAIADEAEAPIDVVIDVAAEKGGGMIG